jgi:predicted transcriptional regulator
MKPVLIELDDDLARRLDAVAPGRSRRRSDFIRQAIREALWDVDERATAEAYRRRPDAEAAYVAPDVWEPHPKRHRAKGRRT